MHTTNDLHPYTVQRYLQAERVLIANVNKGHHFVLCVSFDGADTLTVRDSGFDRTTYSYSKDVVGWRIYDMKPQSESVEQGIDW